MEPFDIFRDLAFRTGGTVYLGVVGPVRTGKSTFIKRFVDLLVLPHIHDPHARQRTQDELPQSGAGRTITTTEPKFVPDEPVRIEVDEGLSVRVRLIDCVGYTVLGAVGYQDENGPRRLRTPWSEEEIPFSQAAEIGTRRVISEHSTIGLVVTTDGSIGDIPRENYLDAEKRVVAELAALGKPFLVVLNTTDPAGPRATQLARELAERYRVSVTPLNCLRATADELLGVLRQALFEFPVREVGVRFPLWVEALAPDHPLRKGFEKAVYETLGTVERVRDIDDATRQLAGYEFVGACTVAGVDLGQGRAILEMAAKRHLFYETLKELTGFEIGGDHDLIRLMQELVVAKRQYDKVAGALHEVTQSGYGIVNPSLEDIVFEPPELIRQGARFGVRLRASAPSVHLIRADIVTEVTPLVGTEKQGEELIRYFSEEIEERPDSLWNTEFLGKPLHEMIREGIASKLERMPEHAQRKLQETLTKIVNEGNGGLICIIL